MNIDFEPFGSTMFMEAGFYSVLVGNSVDWLVSELVGKLSSLNLDACNLITFNRCSSEMDSSNFTGLVNAMWMFVNVWFLVCS
jgi:hypothetical protein